MHSLHLIVTRAKNGEDARKNAESFIGDWGTENNWRQIEAVVRAKDNHAVLFEKPSFYGRDCDTVKKINKLVSIWLTPVYPIEKKEVRQLLRFWINGKVLDNNKLYCLSKFFRHECERGDRKTFNVLKDDFFAYEYDQPGVTHISGSEDAGDIWICFLDMHS